MKSLSPVSHFSCDIALLHLAASAYHSGFIEVECFHLKQSKETFCPLAVSALSPDGECLVVSKGKEVCVRVPPGFRGTAVQVRLHEAGCRIPSSLSGAPGPKSHPFSASGRQQRRQAAGGDAASGPLWDLLPARLVGISSENRYDLCG